MPVKDHVFTLGIEEEFQIIDPETRELRSHVQQIMAEGKITLHERVKPELHQSMVELGTDICCDARYVLPHLHALSVNSPFWLGQNTGLKAYRHMIFERFPRTGIPDAFESLSEYEDFLKLLISTNCIDNAKKIWWDVRLHPFFNTIEFRICDAQSRVDDTVALAALMQAIVAKLQKLRRNNVTFRSYPKRLLDENRWRASRYGLDGKLIDFGRCCEVPECDLLHEMLEFVATEVEELGNQSEIAHIQRIMCEGTG